MLKEAAELTSNFLLVPSLDAWHLRNERFPRYLNSTFCFCGVGFFVTQSGDIPSGMGGSPYRRNTKKKTNTC